MSLALAARRTLATATCDVRLQFRQGFYLAAGMVLVVWGTLLALAALPVTTRELLLPVIILGNVLTNTFYFFAGLVLLEKREGTLEAQIVTPLCAREYLLSKALTLTLLSLVENTALVLWVHGTGFNAVLLVLAIVIASLTLALCGFLTVARYDSINEFLIPSIVYTTLLFLPLFPYFGVGRSWVVHLHPLQPAFELFRSAFVEAELWRVVYGLVAGGLWIGVLFNASERSFLHFIVTREGRRS